MSSGVVFVDFDGTIIRNQSQVLLIRYLYSKREISLVVFLNVMLWGLKYKLISQKINKAFVEKIYKLVLSGRSERQTFGLLKTFVTESLDGAINKEVMGILESYKQNGYKIIIVSSSLDIILKSFNDKYILADEIISTVLEKRDKKYTGKILGSINDGAIRENSVLRRIKELDSQNVVVISDNITDLGILRKADRAIVVNPNNELSRFAKNYNFEIIKI